MLILPLLVPILLCTIVLFVASFLSWVVLPLHRKDWIKLPDEERVLLALRETQTPPGSYMLPGVQDPRDMQTEEFRAKQQAGPIGVITLFPGIQMGRNLGLTLLYFFGVCVCLAYLARMALPPGTEFLQVFRFVSTASLMTFLAAILQHAIWFRCRVTGHVIESLAYAAITGAIFGVFWPAN